MIKATLLKFAMLKALLAKMKGAKKSFSDSTKSPTIIAGLFCLLYLVSDYRRDATPSDVTINFWMALSENNTEQAKKHSIKGSEPFENKQLRNASLQIGKVEIKANKATVETYISRESAASSSFFKTYLTRTRASEPWKINYRHTLKNIKDKNYDNLLDVVVNFKNQMLAPLIAWLKNKENPRLRKIRDKFRQKPI